MSTIIISLVILAAVAGIIASMVKDKKNGKASCGCGCERCAMKGECHKR